MYNIHVCHMRVRVIVLCLVDRHVRDSLVSTKKLSPSSVLHINIIYHTMCRHFLGTRRPDDIII